MCLLREREERAANRYRGAQTDAQKEGNGRHGHSAQMQHACPSPSSLCRSPSVCLCLSQCLSLFVFCVSHCLCLGASACQVRRESNLRVLEGAHQVQGVLIRHHIPHPICHHCATPFSTHRERESSQEQSGAVGSSGDQSGAVRV